jgi:streptogramin lyase
VDQTGTVWIGTDGGGLNRYVPADESFVAYQHDPNNPDSVSRGAVRALYEDSQNNLWVPTFSQGVSLLQRNGQPFVRYTHQSQDPTSLSDDTALAFLEDRDHVLWVGTAEGGLQRFDAERSTFAHYSFPVRTPILSLRQDRRGRFWVGTFGHGLYLFNPTTRTFVAQGTELNDPANRDDDHIWTMHEDRQGALWIGTDDGLMRFDPDSHRVEHFRHDPKNPESLSHDKVRAIYEEDDGTLWIGTFAGIDLLGRDGKFATHYRYDPRDPRSLRRGQVLTIYRDKRGRTWVGTFGGGLNMFNPTTGTFVAYQDRNGLPSNMIFGILEDDAGRLWLSTAKGLCRFDPTSKTVEAFDAANGLMSLQFTRAALRTQKGPMMFGSERGLYVFDPNRIVPNPVVPPIVLTAFKVSNEPRKDSVSITEAEELRLRYNERIFSLEFAVLDYAFPRRSRYQYKLEGFNEDWILLDNTRREAVFTNLDPGEYTFRVKGSNGDGTWDDKGKSLRIVVTPPFWATWWFRTLGVAAIVASLISAHRWRIARHEKRERELEIRVEEAMSRVKILRGLLPICSACKKVRDDQGYWSQIESYIRDRSEADFTHGLCPDCIPKFYPASRRATGSDRG